MEITWNPSPNHSARLPDHPVQILVLHATAAPWSSAFGWLRNPLSKVSAHYLVGAGGQIAQLVKEDRTAWHAGVSKWRGLEVWSVDKATGARIPSVNPVSIGIEIENWNTGTDAYEEVQYQAVLWLSKQIIARRGIAHSNVVGHFDVAPGRKTDPRGWDWARYRREL